MNVARSGSEQVNIVRSTASLIHSTIWGQARSGSEQVNIVRSTASLIHSTIWGQASGNPSS